MPTAIRPRIQAELQSPQMEARIMLKEYLVDDDNQITFPVDLNYIAEELAISVKTAVLDKNVAGLIVKTSDDEPVQVMLNSSDGTKRQRFTLAHELGHYIKRTKGPEAEGLIGFVDYRDEMSGRGIDPEEVWANGFAAELLMPSFAVREFWSVGDSVTKMAKAFGVSQTAMEVRLSSLRLA